MNLLFIEAECANLRLNFDGGAHIAQAAAPRMPTYRHEVVSSQTQPGEQAHEPVGGLQSHTAVAACTERDEMHMCAHELVEQQVAGKSLGTRFEIEQMGFQAQFSDRKSVV